MTESHLGLKDRNLYQNKLVRELGKEFNKDHRVIRQIVNSPIKFTRRVMADPVDDRGIRIRYFGVFSLRHKDAKHNLVKKRVDNLKSRMGKTMVLMASMGFIIQNEESVSRILDEALEQKDYEKINMIWDEYRKTRNKIK